MSVTFNTTEYVASHGRQPRGTGMWAFFFRRNAPVEEAFWSTNTTFTRAKMEAVAEAKRRFGDKACGDVYVGS